METAEDPHQRHLFDVPTVFNVYNSDVINMSVGAPGPDLLQSCTEMISRSTKHRLDEETKEDKYYLFQYGITAGMWECREELSKFLTRRYGDPVRREQLILTCGATHGLQLLLNTILAPNGVIFVEEVTYMIALDVFKQFPTIKIISVPMKEDIVDLEMLEKNVTRECNAKDYWLDEQKIFWGMFYTIPVYHNPTGTTLPPENCKRLVEIAREHSIAVVCDDVYNLLHYGEGLPPHRLFFYDDPRDTNYKGGNVISNGSFSKIFCPAIRIGWIETGCRVVNILRSSGILHSGGAVNHYVSGIITSLLQLRMEDEHLEKLIKIYKDRLEAVCSILDKFLPDGSSYNKPGGGYFIWIHLPSDVDGKKFIEWCQNEYKVSAIPGIRFSNDGKSKNCLRLSIAFHSKEKLTKATFALCTGLSKYELEAQNQS